MRDMLTKLTITYGVKGKDSYIGIENNNRKGFPIYLLSRFKETGQFHLGVGDDAVTVHLKVTKKGDE